MGLKKKAIALGTLLFALGVQAADVSGWSMGTSGIWRLNEDPDYQISKGSPARMLRADRTVLNHEARFTLRQGLVNSFSFRVGCVFRSQIPSFEIDVQPLDIRISDQFNGYTFARFMVDNDQEYSLRGEYLPPARLIFAPLSRSQEKSISDLFLQLREGGVLHVALLQGEKASPRVFSIPLSGFMQLSDVVSQDCVRLNKASGVRTTYAPDYTTREPAGYVKHGWTFKRTDPNDGLEPQDKNLLTLNDGQDKSQSQIPEVQLFEPGGGVASIGADGKPITDDSNDTHSDDDLGEAQGPMAIGADGNVIAPSSNASN